jgi:hypothetical protein
MLALTSIDPFPLSVPLNISPSFLYREVYEDLFSTSNYQQAAPTRLPV